jgi:RNA polymerase sigma factor (sigma-70 family)
MTQLPKADTSQDLERLFAEARAGCAQARDRLLASCRDKLLQIVDRHFDAQVSSRIAPDDWVEEVFLEARRRFSQLGGSSPADLDDWLRQIFLDDVLDFTRSDGQMTFAGNRRAEEARDEVAGSNQTPQHEERMLYQALNRLPLHHRQIILWRNRERFTFEQIASRFACSKDEVRKVWLRALEILSQELNP